MRRALLLASLFGAAAAGAQSTSTVGLIRTDDGGTQDGGPTFNGFVLQHPLVAKGDLSKDDIRKVVEAHQLEIRDCYHALLKRSARKKPLPQGTVKLKFEVSPEGTVKTADLAPGGIDDAAFTGCVVEHVKQWTFPLPRGGGPVKVSYPLTLDPTD